MRLCHFDDLPDGDSRGFDPRGTGQDTLLVVRHADGLAQGCLPERGA
jgi:hypothetical protein